MSARDPEELDHLFADALNAGDLDALVELYEPGAVLRPQPGQFVAGVAGIRGALAGFLGMKPTISMSAKTLGHTGDIALVTARWELSGNGPDGQPMRMSGESVEVSRRQADGSWRFVIDAPWGLEESAQAG